MVTTSAGCIAWLIAAARGALLMLAAMAVGVAHAADSAPAEDATRSIEQVLRAYEDAWSQHDAKAIASFYYEPAMRVSPSGPTVRGTREVQQAFFQGFVAKLVQDGYASSRWERLDVRLLDADTAIASGVIVRERGDGRLFQRQSVTYALTRTQQGWKIFLSATHEPSTALRFERPQRE